ncbi:MAG TPA: hypothetical protein VNA16_10170, partial [Abditibacteriaceae bacterium]|nr:hypothetical protein [Abditibacteriaceae bacterium]
MKYWLSWQSPQNLGLDSIAHQSFEKFAHCSLALNGRHADFENEGIVRAFFAGETETMEPAAVL